MSFSELLGVFDDMSADDLARAVGCEVEDVIDRSAVSPGEISKHAVGLVSTARRRRLPRSRITVVGSSYDPTYRTFDIEGVTYRLIGASGDDNSDTPIFDALHKSFESTMPSSSYVRLDSPESYSDFRSARRAPYVSTLEEKLAVIEDSLDDLYDTIDSIDRDTAVRDIVEQTARGGITIPLPPDLHSRAIETWQDGPEILCTIRFVADDGSPRLATTGAPAEKSLSEATRAADVLGLDIEKYVCAAPIAAQVLGASSLVPHLCGALPQVVECLGSSTGVVKVVPAMDPKVAAAMALVQRGHGGDGRAVAEVSKLNQRDPGLVEHALGCLTYARGGAT